MNRLSLGAVSLWLAAHFSVWRAGLVDVEHAFRAIEAAAVVGGGVWGFWQRVRQSRRTAQHEAASDGRLDSLEAESERLPPVRQVLARHEERLDEHDQRWLTHEAAQNRELNSGVAKMAELHETVHDHGRRIKRIEDESGGRKVRR